MEITYSPDIPYNDRSIRGIFSFSLYTEGRSNILDSVLEGKEIYRPITIIYLHGITSYLAMIESSSPPEAAGGAGAAAPTAGPWEGWKVVIHTDKETVDANPKTFAMLRGRGAIVSIVTITDTTLDPADAEKVSWNSLKVNSILRTARFQPMFHTGVPVFARDADTLFRSLLEAIQVVRGDTESVGGSFSTREEIVGIIRKNPTIFVERLNPLATPDMFFPQKLSNWESHCLSMMQRKQAEKRTTFFVGIDHTNNFETRIYDKYGRFDKIPENTHPIILGDDPDSRTRGLAGFVSSLEQVTEEANKMLPNYATYVFSNLGSRLWYMLDEIYLSYVLYRFAKREGKLGFIVADYVNTDTIIPFCQAISSSSVRTNIYDSFTPVIAYCVKIKKITDDWKYALSGGTELFWARAIKEMVYLLYPEFHLPRQAFVNPLIEGNTKILNANAAYEPLGISRKFSYPQQKYGGARHKTRRRQRRRKTTRRRRG